jgi:predicted AAA+ superfamily ATPase
MVRDILLIQKRELDKILSEKYIDRGIKLNKNNLIQVIIGPRRSGKSFYAVHSLNKLENFGYANFDDEKLVETTDYNEIISTINDIYQNPKNLLFDEIQNLDKWELFVNRLQRQGYNIILTGSNSKLLSKERSTHLTGRHQEINLLPFSFREFIKLENSELTESEIQTKLVHYITYGGYPEPLIKKIDYKDYLSTLFSSIIYKDIVKRFKIRAPLAIEDLATYLISNIANEYSYNTLTQTTKCKSVHTIEKYLNYLEEVFIFFKLHRFSYKIKEQLSFNKKIYVFDNGFYYAKSFQFGFDMGRLYENIVAIELKRSELLKKCNFFYWKSIDNYEVDFVIKEGLGISQLIQVCYDIDNIKTKDREIRSLIKASLDLKCNNLLIINNKYEKEELINWFGTTRKIKFIPLWKWLINIRN